MARLEVSANHLRMFRFLFLPFKSQAYYFGRHFSIFLDFWAGRRADFEAFPTRIRPKSGSISGPEALLRNIGYMAS